MKSITYPLAISISIVLITFAIFDKMDINFSDVLHQLKEHPIQYGIASFMVLASDIVLPVPSSIVLYINGYFLGVLFGALVSISGLMVGCIIGYFLGKASSNIFKSERNKKADPILELYGPPAIFLTRGIPILSESICFVCGYNKVNFKHYLLFNFIGYLPICLLHAIFGNLGYQSSSAFLISFVFSIGISLVFWFFGKKLLANSRLI